MSVYAPDKNGTRKNVAAAYEQPADYAHNPWYLGCIVGRYANRIAHGRFTLDGQLYQLPVNNDGNHLHGGFEGFQKKVWAVSAIIKEEDHVGVAFTYTSRDGEEAYPGNLTVNVRYLLDHQDRLLIEYAAVTDKRTPLSFTNHSYFNLSGFEQPLITDHLLQVNALHYTEKNDRNTPTGRILPVAGTALDFTTPGRIGERLGHFPKDMGLDHNFVLDRPQPGATVHAATLEETTSGRYLKVFTDRPGIQVYTANYWDGSITGQQKKPYVKHGAVALETQAFPDSPNHPQFPDTILSPGEDYKTVTMYEFGVK